VVRADPPSAPSATGGVAGGGATGASVPWTRYEAEDARSNASTSAASRTYLTPESEASGRRLVSLAKAGDSIEFSVRAPAGGLVVRYSIPDSDDGRGADATLSLLINGTPRGKLALTSRLSWIYGDFPWTNDPRAGRGHCFFDECRTLIPTVAPGDVIRLQIGAGDTAQRYLVDFIELEAVPAPLPRPENSLSVLDFGATPNDRADDADAFLRCIDAAKTQRKAVWVPAGDFVLDGTYKPLGGVDVRGAGMWHSRLGGGAPMFHGTGETFTVSDLAIVGRVNSRDDSLPETAFNGNFGAGSRLSRVWMEHLKCGVWSTHGTRNFSMHGCRIRNTMADGVNLSDGTTDSVVEECHLRNTGDDALATWSPTADWSSKQPCQRNRFIRNTVECPWHANGIGLYGGKDHRVQGNLVTDTVASGGGVLVSSGHEACPFEGVILIEDNRFIRTGGECYIGERNGGLWIHAKDSDILGRVVVRNLAVLDSAHHGVTIHGPRSIRDLTLENVLLRGAAEPGILVSPSAAAVTLDAVGVRVERTGSEAGLPVR